MLDLSKPARSRVPRVLIASPSTSEGKIAFFQALDALRAYTPASVALTTWQPCAGSNICENQNELVTIAEQRNADYILFIETDMATFPPQSLEWLLSHDKNIIGCTYPWKDPGLLAQALTGKPTLPRYMGKELDGEAVTFQTLVERESPRPVQFIPMGLTLISMKAINQVRDHRTAKTTPTLPDGVRASAFMHQEAYVPAYNAHRTIATTTDASFCGFAQAAGLDVWLDGRLSLLIAHVGDAAFAMLPETWTPAEWLEKASCVQHEASLRSNAMQYDESNQLSRTEFEKIKQALESPWSTITLDGRTGQPTSQIMLPRRWLECLLWMTEHRAEFRPDQ